MSELSELEKRQIEYKEYCKDTRKNKAHPIDFKMWLVFKFKAQEDLRKQLQKLKEYTVHKSSCELVSLAFTNIPIEERKCTCGLNELLNQSK